MATSKTTAVAKYELSKSMQEQMAMSEELSRSKIVPMAYIGNAAGIFAAVMYGKELGLKPMTSLQNIAVINGKPTLGTDMFLGLAMRHPEWGGYEIAESTDKKATVKVFRVYSKSGKVVTFSYTFAMEDAIKAGLVRSGGPWDKWARRMLKHRATAFALRDAFPDVLSGIYTDEEMDPDKGAAEEAEIVGAQDRIVGEEIEDRPVPVERVNKIAPPKKAAPAKATSSRKSK